MLSNRPRVGADRGETAVTRGILLPVTANQMAAIGCGDGRNGSDKKTSGGVAPVHLRKCATALEKPLDPKFGDRDFHHDGREYTPAPTALSINSQAGKKKY
jgi:hypothetical protein